MKGLELKQPTAHIEKVGRSSSSPRVKPFLKWAGGKSQLLPILRSNIPETFGSYFEPFLGGGALFFDQGCERAYLSDLNPELINCYEAVRNAPRKLLCELSKYSVSEEEFYRVRSLDPETLTAIERAARLIFLNKTCFNGLYRVNRQGKFNTPFGAHKSVRFVNEEELLAASTALQGAVLFCASYDEIVLERAQKGDFIYFDPPYLPVSVNSDFKRYTRNQFYEEDHVRLAEVFRVLDKRGCAVLLSNSFHPKVKELYRDYRLRTVSATRFINCKGGSRGEINELLITNY